MIALAQRANLETREAKHAPRSLAEQRATWRTEAEVVLGAGGVDRMLTTVFAYGPEQRQSLTASWLVDTSARVIDVIERERPMWQATTASASARDFVPLFRCSIPW